LPSQTWETDQAHDLAPAGVWTPPSVNSRARPVELVIVSADTPAGLDAVAREVSLELVGRPDRPLAEVARELQLSRPHGRYRRAHVVRDTADAARSLGADTPPREPVERERPIAFLFPGVADQHIGMGRGLYDHEPIFRSALDHLAELLRPEIGVDLREVLYSGDAESDGTARRGTRIDLAALLGRRRAEAAPIERTIVAQPLVFCVEYALARLLNSWGITPSAMAGYSIGEYTAACLAGVFSPDDAAMLVARRAGFVEMVPSGAMLVVSLSEDELVARLHGALSLAAINGPGLCVVAGPTDDVERFERRLRTSHACG
jgi:acyl transferase domain-containing protein